MRPIDRSHISSILYLYHFRDIKCWKILWPLLTVNDHSWLLEISYITGTWKSRSLLTTMSPQLTSSHQCHQSPRLTRKWEIIPATFTVTDEKSAALVARLQQYLLRFNPLYLAKVPPQYTTQRSDNYNHHFQSISSSSTMSTELCNH